jgi:hypothetical protein
MTDKKHFAKLIANININDQHNAFHCVIRHGCITHHDSLCDQNYGTATSITLIMRAKV